MTVPSVDGAILRFVGLRTREFTQMRAGNFSIESLRAKKGQATPGPCYLGDWSASELRPNHKSEHLPSVAEIKFEKRVLAIRRMTNQLAPFGRRSVDKVLNTTDELLQCSGVIHMRIDTH